MGSTSSLHQLDRTHAVLHASLPHLAAIPPSSSRMVTPCIAYHRSLYSLHAAAEEAKRQQHSLTGALTISVAHCAAAIFLGLV